MDLFRFKNVEKNKETFLTEYELYWFGPTN
jgi:hypothetical protein